MLSKSEHSGSDDLFRFMRTCEPDLPAHCLRAVLGILHRSISLWPAEVRPIVRVRRSAGGYDETAVEMHFPGARDRVRMKSVEGLGTVRLTSEPLNIVPRTGYLIFIYRPIRIFTFAPPFREQV